MTTWGTGPRESCFIRGANHNWPIIANLSDAELESNPPEGITLGAI